MDRAPGDSPAHGFLGMFQICSGALHEALASMQLALRHCPYPKTYLHYYGELIPTRLGENDKVLKAAEPTKSMEGDEPYGAALLGAIHGIRGDERRARELVQEFLEDTPSFGLRNIQHSELCREPERLDLFLGLLRQAGVPD